MPFICQREDGVIYPWGLEKLLVHTRAQLKRVHQFLRTKAVFLSVIVRENRAVPKELGWPFTFIFSRYKSYTKRLTTIILAEVGVHFFRDIIACHEVSNGGNFGNFR